MSHFLGLRSAQNWLTVRCASAPLRVAVNRQSAPIWFAVSLTLAVVALMGAGKSPRLKGGEFNPEHDTVELFSAMEAGQIAVKFIPRDSTEAQVLIENKTQKPLNVKLPAAFAGVPVLAQFAPFGGNNGNNNAGGQPGGGQAGGSQNQSVGGGAGQNVNNRAAPRFFNIPAEKVGKLKLPIVCLEHAKPAPRAGIPYKIVPLSAFSDSPEVAAVCTLLGTGELDQRAAQVAAWHYANEMTLAELSAKEIEHLDGSTERYFTPEEIRRGKLAVERAATLASARPAENPESGTVPVINAVK